MLGVYRVGMRRGRPYVLTYCQYASAGQHGVPNETIVNPRELMFQNDLSRMPRGPRRKPEERSSTPRRSLGECIIDGSRARSGETVVHFGIHDFFHKLTDDVVMAVRRQLELRDGSIGRHELGGAQRHQSRHLALCLRSGGHAFGSGAGDPPAPGKSDNQGRNDADCYSLQQASTGLSLQDRWNLHGLDLS